METFIVAPLNQGDAISLFTLMTGNSKRFQRFFPNTLGQNLSVEASKNYIELKRKENQSKSEFTWAIKAVENGNIVGLIILKELNWNKKQGELAYCIDKGFEGRGWITNAVKEISKFAFEELRLNILQIIVHNSNKGSIKVAEKCGYKWQSTLKAEFTPPNEAPMDMELYELSL